MRRLILVLFVSALMVACSSEESEDTANTASDTKAAATAQDKVSDSEYAKKYGAAMKQAMSKDENGGAGEGSQ